MGCGLCPQVYSNATIREEPPQDLVVYRATSQFVQGQDGKPYPLNQPLVPPAHFPRGEWYADIKVVGIVRRLFGETAMQVFNQAMKLFELNSQPYRVLDLWLNLNMQWVPRVATKYQIVTPLALKNISDEI